MIKDIEIDFGEGTEEVKAIEYDYLHIVNTRYTGSEEDKTDYITIEQNE